MKSTATDAASLGHISVGASALMMSYVLGLGPVAYNSCCPTELFLSLYTTGSMNTLSFDLRTARARDCDDKQAQ
jgi:hypothetical protein